MPVIDALVADLSAVPGVLRIILFGSRARGDARPRSDIDLAVDAPDLSPREWQRLLDLVEQARTLLSFDIVRFDQAPAELLARIAVEGRLLYERRPTAAGV